MKIKILNKDDFPKIPINVRKHIEDGFWCFYEIKKENGKIEFHIRTEKKIFKISKKGNVINIFDLKDFSGIITCRLIISKELI